MNKKIPIIKGKTVDNETRCTHYHSVLDIIAIKFKCCETYYPCFSCHEENTHHTPQVWSKNEFDNLAILCGVCKHEMTINEYFMSDSTCPKCKAGFNPKCSNHYHLYFEID
jgi:uncharacterized CHY-type Zn-finger protein